MFCFFPWSSYIVLHVFFPFRLMLKYIYSGTALKYNFWRTLLHYISEGNVLLYFTTFIWNIFRFRWHNDTKYNQWTRPASTFSITEAASSLRPSGCWPLTSVHLGLVQVNPPHCTLHICTWAICIFHFFDIYLFCSFLFFTLYLFLSHSYFEWIFHYVFRNTLQCCES